MKKYLEVHGWPRRSHSWNRRAFFIYFLIFAAFQVGILEKVTYSHIHFCIHKSSNKKNTYRKIHKTSKNLDADAFVIKILMPRHSYKNLNADAFV